MSNWKKRMKTKKDMDELVRKAEAGDKDSVKALAFAYYYARRGFSKDFKAAVVWMKRGHGMGFLECTGAYGEMLIKGLGTEQDTVRGMMYLERAQGGGSDLAACFMGIVLAIGFYGIKADEEEALVLLEKSLSGASVKHLSARGNEVAKKLIDKIKAARAS